MKRICFIPALMLAMSACASGPDYREARTDRSEGYSQQIIEAGRYRIQYKLDEDHIGKAQDYALLRAAELTMEQGYQTFEVVDETADVDRTNREPVRATIEQDYVVTRDCGLLSCRTTARPTFSRTEIGTVVNDDETIVTLEILLSNDDASAHPDKYDASQVAANIRARLG